MSNENVLLEARQLISGFLKNRRVELNITQDQLAELSGMGVATIRRFESGKFWLNLKQYLILCHHLKCYPFIEEIESDKQFAKNDVEIIKGHVSQDHIHLFVSVPPNISISQLLQYLKGKSSYKLMFGFKELQKQFWGQHLWARGYFACSSGNITDEVIMKYIDSQDVTIQDDDFKISGELKTP